MKRFVVLICKQHPYVTFTPSGRPWSLRSVAAQWEGKPKPWRRGWWWGRGAKEGSQSYATSVCKKWLTNVAYRWEPPISSNRVNRVIFLFLCTLILHFPKHLTYQGFSAILQRPRKPSPTESQLGLPRLFSRTVPHHGWFGSCGQRFELVPIRIWYQPLLVPQDHQPLRVEGFYHQSRLTAPVQGTRCSDVDLGYRRAVSKRDSTNHCEKTRLRLCLLRQPEPLLLWHQKGSLLWARPTQRESHQSRVGNWATPEEHGKP